jgi:hypothetical protein
MAVNLSLTEALKASELMLGDATGINDPGNYEKDLGFLQYLFSASNKKTIQTEMGRAANGGKYRPVEVRYTPKKGQDDLSEAASGYSCTKGTTRREIVQTLNPTLFAIDQFTIDEQITREGTQMSFNERVAKELKDAMLNLRENIDKQLFAAAITDIGANPAQGTNEDAYTTIQMLNSDGTLSASTFDTIVNDAQDNMMSTPAIIGSNNMRKVVNRLNVGDTASGGINYGGVQTSFGVDFYNDAWTTTNFGAATNNRVIACYPGLQQFYSYNFYVAGGYDKEATMQKTVMADPVYPGIKYDVSLKWDDGCTGNDPQGYIVGNVFLYFDLWTPPVDAFGDGYSTNLNDFTGIVGYNITSA